MGIRWSGRRAGAVRGAVAGRVFRPGLAGRVFQPKQLQIEVAAPVNLKEVAQLVALTPGALDTPTEIPGADKADG